MPPSNGVRKKPLLRKQIYLIGYSISEMSGARLPSRLQVIQFLFHCMHPSGPGQGNLSLSSASGIVADKLIEFWNRAHIPFRSKSLIVKQIKALYNEWRSLQKTANRRDDTQLKREQAFRDLSLDLFDIATANALKSMTNEEDKQFLINQRSKGRVGCMLVKDRKLHLKEKRAVARKASEHERLQKYIKMQGASTSKPAGVGESEGDSDFSEVDHSQPVYGDGGGASTSSVPQKKKRGRKKIVTADLVATLDTEKTSVRSGTKILLQTAKGLHANIDDLNINKSSLHRARTSLREKTAKKVRDDFQASLRPNSKLVVHYDGKRMKTSGGTLEERLPIVVTGSGIEEQLLAAPKLSDGTGKEQAAAVYSVLTEWNLNENLVAICTDTTKSMTGHMNGANILLQNMVGRPLLYLACRHHMAEVVLKGVFEAIVCPSSGPDITIFKRFRDAWPGLDQTKIRTGLKDKVAAPHLKQKTKDLLQFLGEYLQIGHSRGDYKELLELSCIFLGGVPPRGLKFYKPGAIHDARFMSRAIYSLKIYIFQDQFKLTAREKTSFREMCLFLVLCYVKYWFETPCAVSAPGNDLQFMKNLLNYECVNKKVSEVAAKKLAGHTWYLTPQLSGLGLLDPNISLDCKQKMVQKIILVSEQLQNIPDSPPMIKNPQSLKSKDLSDFVGPSTLHLFKRFELEHSFVTKPPDQWDSCDDFRKAREYFSDLHVVNDVAERCVALTQEHLERVKSETNFQNLLIVAHNTRKITKDCTKASLSFTLYDV